MTFLLAFASLLLPAQDFNRQVDEAGKVLQPQLEKSQELIRAGELDAANAAVLNVFPEGTRTPVQAFVLGNVLFGNSPKVSYALHRLAVEKLPDEPDVQLEWAMEQHRAGEYAGASAAYAKYCAAVPDYAPAWGLAADSLIRQGKVKEAIAAWEASEKAKTGTLERFESLVCEIHTREPVLQKRQDLFAAMKKGDLDSGVQLIALDCRFPRDWWNFGPERSYLKNDLAAFRAMKFPAGRRIDAVECAAACAMAEPDDAKTIADALRLRGFLLDADRSIPEDGKLAAFLVDRAEKLLDIAARKVLIEKLLAAARKKADVGFWNTAMLLLEDDSAARPLDKEAWEATKDSRFAIAYLMNLDAAKQLKADDPLLAEALKTHPESAGLNRVLLKLAVRDGRLTEDLLVQGIKAEYRRFSVSGVNPRPRAATLRLYFKELAKIAK